MVILNMFGKIEPICISQKMKLYISNLPNSNENNWNSYVVKEFKHALKIHVLSCRVAGVENKQNLKLMYEERVGADNSEVFQNESALIQEIVDNIIYIYLDYSYDDMPMGGWDENPFDGRLCEKDYAEIIVDFFVSCWMVQICKCRCGFIHQIMTENGHTTVCFLGKGNLDEQINALKIWGQKLDSFLLNRTTTCR